MRACGVSDVFAFVDEGLGNSSYLVNLGDRRALVIDPARDPGPYLATAESHGLTIAFSAETHLHADFVSGSRELAAQAAEVLASKEGATAFPHRDLVDGQEVDLGGLTLRALATPGHTPEHLSYLLLDGTRPLALFSGGSLLVGAVARTDLIDPERTEELARDLWRSLQDRILGLPDDLTVYPTHGAGSFCAAPSGTERTTTIGAEKAHNRLLAVSDEDAFVKLLLGGLGSYPPYFLRLRDVNRQGPVVHGPGTPSLRPLEAEEVQKLVGEGAMVVDVRPISSYAAGHIPGSISIQLRDQFATWLGWLIDPDRPTIFVLDRDQDRGQLVRQARNVGYERLAGELAGGMAAWRSSGLPERRIRLVPAAKVTGLVLDVRQDAEYTAGHVPGARHVELGSVATAEIDNGPLAVMCGHGERAMSAASMLEAAGHTELTVVQGGPTDWATAQDRSLETGGL